MKISFNVTFRQKKEGDKATKIHGVIESERKKENIIEKKEQ